jgi:hypothetical protein
MVCLLGGEHNPAGEPAGALQAVALVMHAYRLPCLAAAVVYATV